MKQRMFFAPLAMLAAILWSEANAQQLPGFISLGGVPNGYRDFEARSLDVREYFHSFLPSTPYYYTAALITANNDSSSVLAGDGTPFRTPLVLGCNGGIVEAYGMMDHGIVQRQKIGGKWKDVTVWRYCTNATQIWPPTGQRLIYGSYPGGFRPTRSSTKAEWWFYGTLYVPREAKSSIGFRRRIHEVATEWTVW